MLPRTIIEKFDLCAYNGVGTACVFIWRGARARWIASDIEAYEMHWL